MYENLTACFVPVKCNVTRRAVKMTSLTYAIVIGIGTRAHGNVNAILSFNPNDNTHHTGVQRQHNS